MEKETKPLRRERPVKETPKAETKEEQPQITPELHKALMKALLDIRCSYHVVKSHLDTMEEEINLLKILLTK